MISILFRAKAWSAPSGYCFISEVKFIYLFIQWLFSESHPCVLARWRAHQWFRHGPGCPLEEETAPHKQVTVCLLKAHEVHSLFIVSHGGLAQATHRAKPHRIVYQLVDSWFKLAEEELHSKTWWMKCVSFWATKIPYTIWQSKVGLESAFMTANNTGPAFVAFICLAILGRLPLLTPRRGKKLIWNSDAASKVLFLQSELCF